MKIKIAHVADCHLGGWRRESLNKLGYEAFEQMIDLIIKENVDFLIISGDLYDVSNPKVDVVDIATKQLTRLKDNHIPVYGIMGSHDFSPSNKSMLRPLISARLFKNVSKPIWDTDEKYPLRLQFFEDEKTNIKITGMRARKRGVELEDYHQLHLKSLDSEPGTKIFVLHTMLNELKPKDYANMSSGPKSILPKNFLYYAGGHIHQPVPEKLRDGSYTIKCGDSLEKKVVYPGVLYPTNFRELEKLQYGGFCIVSGEIPGGDLEVRYISLPIKQIHTIFIDANNKSTSLVKEILEQEIARSDVEDKIVIVRIEGVLSSGRPSELNTTDIIDTIKAKDAYEVLINKNQLNSDEYEKIFIDSEETNEEIENRLINEHAQKIEIPQLPKEQLIKSIHQILASLGREKEEGEKVADYDEEMVDLFFDILNIKLEEEDT